MVNVVYDMIAAICRGDFQRVEEYVNTYGLKHSPQWGDGYFLLKNSTEAGHTEISKFLLEKGSKVNIKDSSGCTPLHYAVKNGDMEMTKILLHYSADINAIDDTGSTSLYYAIMCKKLAMCHLLIEHGASVHVLNRKNESPLSIAIQTQSADIVEYLLNQGASVVSEESVLHKAVSCGNEVIVDAILNRGPNVNCIDNYGKTPLHIGIERKVINMNILENLIKHGANVNFPDKPHGKFPIHIAAEKGYCKVIQLLINHGAIVDPIITSDFEEVLTPLLYAISKGCNKSVILLLDAKANCNITDKNGKMPIHIAAEKGHTEITELLLKKDALVNEKITSDSQKGLTPLHLAVLNGHTETVKVLLKYGATIDSENIEGHSVLYTAVCKQDLPMVEELLKFNPNVSKPSNGKSLHIALELKDVDGRRIVEKLVEYGFTMNSEDIHNENFIASAIRNNYEHILTELLKHGANPNLPNNNLQAAIENGHTDIATKLIEHGATVGKDFLHIAVKSKSTTKELVELLLNHGADPNSKDLTGKTPLHYCVLSDGDFLPQNRVGIDNDKIEIAKVLFNYSGTTLNRTDKNGQTVLHLAVKARNLRMINEFQLIKSKIDVNIVDKNGHSVLYTAVESKNFEIVEEILKFNPDIFNKSNRKALNIAICSTDMESQDKEIVEKLDQFGFVVNPEDIDILKILSFAIYKNYLRIVNHIFKNCTTGNIELFRNASNIKICGNNYNSLMSIAVARGHNQMAELLIEHGAALSPDLLHLAIDQGNKQLTESLLCHGADPNLTDEDGRNALHCCVQSRSDNNEMTQIAKLICKSGVQINHEDHNGFTALNIAVKRRKLYIFMELLLYHPDVNNKSNRECLHTAIYDETDVSGVFVDSLLKNGFSVIKEDAKNIKLMHYAIKNNYLSIVDKLLKFGADPSSSYDPDFNGKIKSHLYVAIENGRYEIIKLLLAHGVDIKDTALHLAVERVDKNLVELLLQHGANIDLTDNHGKTALHYCASPLSNDQHPTSNNNNTPNISSRMIDIFNILLISGANIDAVDDHGCTILNYLVRKMDLDIIRELLKNKPDRSNQSNRESLRIAIYQNMAKQILNSLLDYGFTLSSDDVNDGKTVIGAVINDHYAILEQLLQLGADPNLLYEDISNPGRKMDMLSAAVLHGNSKIAELIIKYGANVKSELLHMNVEKENKNIVTLLLGHGADPNFVGEGGKTALHFFVSNDRNPLSTIENCKIREEIVEILLEKGAYVNARDNAGNSPLHDTCKSGIRRPNVHIAEILIKSGASIEMQNKRGETPLHVAVNTHNREMFPILLRYGANIYTQSGFGSTLFEHASPDVITTLLHFDFNNEKNSKVIVDTVKYYMSPYMYGDYDYNEDNVDSDWAHFRFSCLQEYVIMAEEIGYSLRDEHPLLAKIRHFKEVSDFIAQCRKEVNHMKDQVIGDTKLSYYDFIRKRSHQLAICLKNKAMVEFLERGEYKESFPIYAGVIEGNFTRGKTRKNLIEKVNEKYYNLFPVLPSDCIDVIMSYLNNEDLKVLIS